MSIPAIQSVIAQMTTKMVSINNSQLAAAPQTGFASHLLNAVAKINQTRVNASQKAQALTLETPGVELNDVCDGRSAKGQFITAVWHSGEK